MNGGAGRIVGPEVIDVEVAEFLSIAALVATEFRHGRGVG
jgi:hypothetical protein